MRAYKTVHLSECLPGFASPKTYSPWPVWRGSVAKPVQFTPSLTKRDAVKQLDQLEDLEARTRTPGHQDGAVGQAGLRVYRTMLLKFLSWSTGQLDPSHATIAKAAGMSVSTVKRGLATLRGLNVVTWLRRCREGQDEAGQFMLMQTSNAYAILPASQWKGYTPKPEAAPPHPDTWGAAPVIERGTVEAGTFDAEYERMELDAKAKGGDRLSAALALLGRTRDAAAGGAPYWTLNPGEKLSSSVLHNAGTGGNHMK